MEEEVVGGGFGRVHEGAGGSSDFGGAVGGVAGVVDVFHGEEAIEPAEETGAKSFGGGGVGADFGEGAFDVLGGEELLEWIGEFREWGVGLS